MDTYSMLNAPAGALLPYNPYINAFRPPEETLHAWYERLAYRVHKLAQRNQFMDQFEYDGWLRELDRFREAQG